MRTIEHKTMDGERALYGSHSLVVKNCAFTGPADGESALKECSDVSVENTLFNLRYPCWHVDGLSIKDSQMTELCRAAMWYSRGINLENVEMHGIKALRECSEISIKGCDIISPEFGWSCHGVDVSDTKAQGEYFMMRSTDIHFKNVRFTGKYSFQYIENAVFENCDFDTKDAFWHARNVVVRNSTVKGEYLAWYCENVTFENCRIIGTQPLCYCKGLRLVDCEMVDADLAFENSDVEATITGCMISIKNPASGRIEVGGVDEIIRDDENAKGEIVITGKKCTCA